MGRKDFRDMKSSVYLDVLHKGTHSFLIILNGAIKINYDYYLFCLGMYLLLIGTVIFKKEVKNGKM